MRQCVFVVADRTQLQELLPLLRHARETGLRYSVWFSAERQEDLASVRGESELSASIVIPDRAAPRSAVARILYWVPLTLYRCYYYVHSVKMWTTKSPLVVLHGDNLTTSLASRAGRWGGGQLVHLQHPADAQPVRHAILRKVRFAFCNESDAQERSSRYPGCTVVGVGAGDHQAVVDKLLRWTGGKSRDA